ncbi:PaaI family thioesterase [Desulfofalx alkaliphila]|uniref:PaaI family thioesterase n=1 Tax=Desulfofalx alkaliphila TaxID=105483 RepID=UPI0004E18DBB|nr:PaaI family thioesterase [Desulfofalx alkaliphila]
MITKIKKFFERDRFAAHVGIKIVKAEPGYAVTELEIADKHRNGLDMIQGGVIFTLADFAFAVASNAGGKVTVGINANVAYLKASKGNVLIAEAKEVSASKRICTYKVNVSDDNNDLIAQLSFTGYRKEDRIEF